MSRKTMSPFSFFGGKARFAQDIAEMLDYTHTSVYMEPYGGACSVLLNKPRHGTEIYNDLGAGLVTFFEALSDKAAADKVIRKLNDLEISREEFIKQQDYRNSAELDIYGYITKQTLALLSGFKKKYPGSDKLFKSARKALNGREYISIPPCLNELLDVITDKGDRQAIGEKRDLFERYWKIIEKNYCDNYVHQFMYWNCNKEFDAFSEAELDERDDILLRYLAGEEGVLPPEPPGGGFDRQTEELMKLFLEEEGGIENIITKAGKKKLDKDTYQEAQDGQPKKETTTLHEAIHRIVLDEISPNDMGIGEYSIADLAAATFYTYVLSRDGMGITYSKEKAEDTEAYYRRVSGLDGIADRLEGVKFMRTHALIVINEWRKHSDAMLYLDPSYLNDDKENLGVPYAASSSYKEHVRLLEILTKKDTCAKIMLSNYDVEPYRSGLTEENGWKRHEIETYTAVGGRKGNKRKEVLWYNY